MDADALLPPQLQTLLNQLQHQDQRGPALAVDTRLLQDRHFESAVEAIWRSQPNLQAGLLCEIGQLLQAQHQPEAAWQMYRQAIGSGQLSHALAWEIRVALMPLEVPLGPAEIDAHWQRVTRFLAELTPLEQSLTADLGPLQPYLDNWLSLATLPWLGRNPLPLRQSYSRWFETLLPPELLAPLPPVTSDLPQIGLFVSSSQAFACFWRGALPRLQAEAYRLWLICASPALAAELRIELPAAEIFCLHSDRLEQDLLALRGLNLDLLLLNEIPDSALASLLACCRIAQRQATSLLTPVSTGMPNVDLYLTSRWLEPVAADYSEELVALDVLPGFPTRPAVPPLPQRAEFGLPETGTLYVCPASLLRLTPAFDALLGAILRADPAGQLVLVSHPAAETLRNRLLQRFETSLADVMPRIWFLPELSQADFLALLRLADVMLDPPETGTGAASFEALALGLPIVTWPGALAPSRLTAACYRLLNLPEAIVDEGPAYVALALRLAHDEPFRRHLSERLLAGAGRLFDWEPAIQALQTLFARIRAPG